MIFKSFDEAASSPLQSSENSGDQGVGEMGYDDGVQEEVSKEDHASLGSGGGGDGNGSIEDGSSTNNGVEGALRIDEEVAMAPKKTSPPSSSKDPSRPRRKKARRACYACQRAHLTCGDERPCQRCIKRGLQDACQDGLRKKAKYLRDAPDEALLPGTNTRLPFSSSGMRRAQHPPHNPSYPIPAADEVYGQNQGRVPTSNATYPIYGVSPPSVQLSINDRTVQNPTFSVQQSPLSPTSFRGQMTSSPNSSMRSLVQAIEPPAPPDPSPIQEFVGGLFDPGDLSQFNFDPASFNFGNTYGAMEFGVLGQIADTPSTDPTAQFSQPGSEVTFTTPAALSTPSYSTSPAAVNRLPQSLMLGHEGGLGEWRPPTQLQSNVRHMGSQGIYESDEAVKQRSQPNAFSIAAASSFASPTSEESPSVETAFETGASRPMFSPTSSPTNVSSSMAQSFPLPSSQNLSQNQQSAQLPQESLQLSQQAQQQQRQKHLAGRTSAPMKGQLATSGQWSAASVFAPTRRRGDDPSNIYDTVTQPYSYTAGFHSLISFLKKRFPPDQTMRIAKALASIRPSFIAATKTLGQDDLIFMEKCFQRTLYEYEDFISLCSTPTIVCRRTGEVAAVGKEFTLLTGWRKDVLLGKEMNLNINTGKGFKTSTSETAASTSTSGSAGTDTPRGPIGSGPASIDLSRPQPVFLAELLDDESVIEFYEDFSRMAFGNARGGINTRYRLLKYKSKEDEEQTASGRTGVDRGKRGRDHDEYDDENDGDHEGDEGAQEGRPAKKLKTGRGNGQAQASINDLGNEDGKILCSCCWTVKRDIFNLPMMIVMNFLPCI